MGYRGPQLAELFSDAPVESAGKLMAKDLVAALHHEIKINTPVGQPPHGVDPGEHRDSPGHLRDSWEKSAIIKTTEGWEGSVFTVVEYAEFVERGTGLYGPFHKAYKIRPKNPNGTLHWVGAGGEHFFAKEVTHPGSPGAFMILIGCNVIEAHFEKYAAKALRLWKLQTETRFRRAKRV